MPTTPGGTAYTRYAHYPGDGQSVGVIVPDLLAGVTDRLVVYLHGNGGAWNDFYSGSQWAPTLNGLMDAGIAVVEALGYGDAWGADIGVQAYAQAIAIARTRVPGRAVGILGRSMGGLSAYRLAADSGYADQVQALAINSGTTALRTRYSVAVGSDVVDFNTAWGVAGTVRDTATFDPLSAGKDPLLDFPLDAYEHLHVMQLWGTADTTVVPSVHGEAWEAKYGSHCKSYQHVIRAGGDHTNANGSYLNSAEMVAFFDAHLVAPTVARNFVTVHEEYIARGGELYLAEPAAG